VDRAKEEELRKEHGDLVVATIVGKKFAFKTPTDTDYEDFQQSVIKLGNDKAKAGPVFREFCLKALVFPSADELEAAFRAKPASAPKICDSLADLAGASVEITVKKG
jgi:hypothetical protein